MSVARTRTWLGFSAAGLVLLAVLSWLTLALMRLDHDELHARRQAALHERLRLALWRMDSWLSPQLTREAMRPAGEFRAFPSATAAWTRGFRRIEPDEIVVKSPLLGSESPMFPLHFELSADGLSSPQVPLANQRDVAEATGVDPAVLARAAARLADLQPVLTPAVLEPKFRDVEVQLPTLGCNPVLPGAPLQTKQSVAEYTNRQRNLLMANMNGWRESQVASPQAAAIAAETMGPMVPVWLDKDGVQLLLFVRRVRNGAASALQGVVVDWPQLEREMLALLVDLFPVGGLRLVRCEAPTTTEQTSMLASVPARLEADYANELASGLPLPLILALTWGVTLLGLCALAFTLRAAIGYGERRARFASAVTHELRTPLTTFRMYSEMLLDGVVQDPAAQREYLTTLQRESDRLSRVVENVLAWSRLEEGRFTSRRERHGVAALVQRVALPMQRRLAEAKLDLHVQIDEGVREATVTTDEDAVGQILFNLADNAAKYACSAVDRRVDLQVTKQNGLVRIAVRDHGPGIAPSLQRQVFAPFDRGAVPASSNEVPGVGLGLALARGLARDLGGELRLEGDGQQGACFVLELSAE